MYYERDDKYGPAYHAKQQQGGEKIDSWRLVHLALLLRLSTQYARYARLNKPKATIERGKSRRV
jgi:hypothetical protein